MNIEDYIDEKVEELKRNGIQIGTDRVKGIKQLFLGGNQNYSALSYEEQVEVIDNYIATGLKERRDREQAKQEYGTDYNNPYHLVEVDSKSSGKRLTVSTCTVSNNTIHLHCGISRDLVLDEAGKPIVKKQDKDGNPVYKTEFDEVLENLRKSFGETPETSPEEHKKIIQRCNQEVIAPLVYQTMMECKRIMEKYPHIKTVRLDTNESFFKWISPMLEEYGFQDVTETPENLATLEKLKEDNDGIIPVDRRASGTISREDLLKKITELEEDKTNDDVLRGRIEKTVRSCTSRLGSRVAEEQIQSMISRLVQMEDIKDIVDSLALNIDKFFGKPEQIEEYEACMEDLLQLAGECYESKEDIISQMKENKSKNYTPGNISVEENHKLIETSLKPICDKLNELGVDYYLVGALSTFIGTGTPLFRYHGDIDFMIAEKDIEKVREALEGTDYDFSDDRFDNKRRYTESVGHAQGEHEVIANHRQNEFHLGFFLFRREPDQSMTIREYFMQERENGEKVPMVLERNCPKELVELEYTEQETEYAGTRFRTSTPESVYAKKISTRHEKDMLDIEVLKDKIDERKIAEAQKYQTTLRIVEAIPERDVLSSAIQATEETTRTSVINEQVRGIKSIQMEKTIGNQEQAKTL